MCTEQILSFWLLMEVWLMMNIQGFWSGFWVKKECGYWIRLWSLSCRKFHLQNQQQLSEKIKRYYIISAPGMLPGALQITTESSNQWLLLAVFEDKFIGSFTVITVMICKIFLIHIAVAFLFAKIIGCVFFYQLYKLLFFCAAIPGEIIIISNILFWAFEFSI